MATKEAIAELLKSRDANGREVHVTPITTEQQVLMRDGELTLEEEIDEIYQLIENLEKTPGPQGEKGDKGDRGSAGAVVSETAPEDKDVALWVKPTFEDEDIKQLEEMFAPKTETDERLDHVERDMDVHTKWKGELDNAVANNIECIEELEKKVQHLIDLDGGSLEIQQEGHSIEMKARKINFTGGVEIVQNEPGSISIDVKGTGGGGGDSTPVKLTSTFDKTVCSTSEIIEIPYVFVTGVTYANGTAYYTIKSGIQETTKTVSIKPGQNTWVVGALPKGTHTLTIYAEDAAGRPAEESLVFTIESGAIEIERVEDVDIQYLFGAENQTIDYRIVMSQSRQIVVYYTLIDKTLTNEIVYMKTIETTPGTRTLNFRSDFPELADPVTGLPQGTYEVQIQAQVKGSELETNILTHYVYVVYGDGIVLSSNFVNGTVFTTDDEVMIPVRFSTALSSKFELITEWNRTGAGIADQGIRRDKYSTPRGILSLGKLGVGVYTLNMIGRIDTPDEEIASPMITVTFEVVESQYEKVPSITTNLICWFDANDMSNSMSSRNIWKDRNPDKVGDGVTATLYDYNYNTNGWLYDKELQSNFLRSYGEAYVEIDVAPFKQKTNNQGIPTGVGAPNGLTFDIQFRANMSGDLDAGVVNCKLGNGNGIFIDSYRGNISSNMSEGSTVNYSENELTRYTFVIDRTRGLELIYINGVINRARPISTKDYNLEDYVTNEKVYLNCRRIVNEATGHGELDHFGTCDIFNLRIYDRPLTSDEIVQNHISDIHVPEEQERQWKFNQNNALPKLVFVGRQSLTAELDGMGKNIEKEVRVRYLPMGVGPGEPFDCEACQVKFQGTSSLVYPVKNYKLKLRNREYLYDTDGNPIVNNGQHESKLKKYKYSPYPALENGNEPYHIWKPESTFTLKANFMESSHTNNVGHGKMLHDLYRHLGHYTPPQIIKEATPGEPGVYDDSVRSCIDGFPVAIYYKENDNPESPEIFGGVYMFNIDKGADDTFGLTDERFVDAQGKSRVLSYEVSKNSADSKDSANNSLTGAAAFASSEMAAIRTDFEIRWAHDESEYEENHYELQRLIEWVKDAPDAVFGDPTIFNQYLNLDYCIDYYIHVMTFGMIDNFGKNMVLNTWDGKIWYPCFYDMDSSIGLTNVGKLTVGVDVEPHREDKKGNTITGTLTNGFTTPNSRLWVKLEKNYQKEIKARYRQLRTSFYTFDNIMKYFDGGVMSIIPQRLYNETQEYVYLTPKKVPNENGTGFSTIWPIEKYPYCCNGNRISHIKKWIKERLIFMDSLWGYNTFLGGPIQIRTAVGNPEKGDGWFEVGIKAYSPQYIRVRVGEPNEDEDDVENDLYKMQYTKKVGPHNFVSYKFFIQAHTDQEIFIENGANLLEIRNLENCVVESLMMEQATRLAGLDLNGSDTINGLSVSGCKFLRYLDLNGCVQLGNKDEATGGSDSAMDALDLSACTNLRTVDIQHTCVKGLTLPGAGNALKSLKIQNSKVNTLTVSDSEFLKEMSLDKCLSLTRVSISRCNALSTLSMINTNVETFQLLDCEKLKYLDISSNNKLNTLSLSGCRNLETLKMVGFTNPSMKEINLVDMSNIKKVDFNGSSYVEGIRLPANYRGLKELNAANTSFKYMAFGYTGVPSTELDFDGFELEYATFEGCRNITKIHNFYLEVPEGRSCSPFNTCSNLNGFTNSTIKLRNNADRGFYGCEKLEQWPTIDLSLVTSASRLFEKCHKMTNEVMHQTMQSVTSKLASAVCMYYNIDGITELPTQRDFDGMTGVTNTYHMFASCPNMGKDTVNDGVRGQFENVEGGVLRGLSALESADTMFGNCWSIKGKLPKNMLDGCISLTNGLRMFSGCGLTQMVDADFFKNMQKNAIVAGKTGPKDLQNFFAYNSDMVGTIPGNLFDTLVNLTTVSGFFQGCTSLTGGFPDDMFWTNRKVSPDKEWEEGSKIEWVSDFFKACSKLDGLLPTRILRFKSIRGITGLFSHCYGEHVDSSGNSYTRGLRGIPSGYDLNTFLDKCPNLERAGSLFSNCQLFKIQFPKHFFRGKTKLNYVSWMFNNCKEMTGTLHPDFFKDCKSLQEASGVFCNCVGLTGYSTKYAIPPGFLDYNQEWKSEDWQESDGLYPSPLRDVSRMFEGCTNLSGELPPGLLDYCANVTTTSRMFYYCNFITGAIPNGFLRNMRKLQDASEMFAFMWRLGRTGTRMPGKEWYAFPEDLFWNCTALNNVSGMFNGWTSDESWFTSLVGDIPPKVFHNCPIKNADTFLHCCQKVSGNITKNFFGNNPYLTSISSTFRICGTTSDNKLFIEEGFLDGCPNVTNFHWALSGNGSNIKGYVNPFWLTHGKSGQTLEAGKCYEGTTIVAKGTTSGGLQWDSKTNGDIPGVWK